MQLAEPSCSLGSRETQPLTYIRSIIWPTRPILSSPLWESSYDPPVQTRTCPSQTADCPLRLPGSSLMMGGGTDRYSQQLGGRSSKCLVQRQASMGENEPDMVHTCNFSTLEAVAGGSPQIRGHPGLHSEFQARQGYAVRP